jgi:PAS domain S-box-containing protein
MRMLPHFYVNVPALRAGTVGGYALAFVSVGIATALRSAVDPFVVGVPFVTFWPAVIITALISGVGAGLFCVALSAAAADFFVMKPHLLFYIENRVDLADLLLFLVLAWFSVIIITQLHDAIEREVAERALRESKERLQFALDAAEVGWWQYDPRRLVASGDARFKEIFDVTADELSTEEIRELVHPYDTERFWEDRSAMLDPNGPRRSTNEYRVQRRDGEIRWVRVCRLASREGVGRERRVASLVGTVEDITEHKEWAQREHFFRERLQSALDAAQLGSWQYDPFHRVVSVDMRCKEIFDVAENEEPIEKIMERVKRDDRERVSAAFRAALDPAQPKRSPTQFRLQRGDGEVRWVEIQGLAHLEGAGRERRVVSFIGTVADISERKHSEELVQRQADLLNQSHDAILTLQTGDRGIVYWSRGAERLYGYTAAEAEGRRTHELLQTRAPIPIEDIDAQIVHEGSWYGELTHTTRDGRDIAVESHIVRVSYDGETFALETNRDITERKHHEEREHLIMREMNHRAKNMLGLVQAIARQTTTRDPDDFIERFSERIQALSANQKLLARGEWKGVETEDLVRAQLALFADLVGSRIAVHGPELRLKATGAQAIGLALHELATNAGKYGALSMDRGRVDICWATDGDTFTMSWTERDGPQVSPPQRRGFGTVVMQEMAERSMDGKVDLDYAPSGVTWRVTCPVANALESNGDTQLTISPRCS